MKRRLFYLCLLVAVVGALALPAHASKDEVQFGSTIHVPRDGSIHDAVCFFCDVDADGTVEGDIVVFFGDVHIGTAANHDVVNFFGNDQGRRQYPHRPGHGQHVRFGPSGRGRIRRQGPGSDVWRRAHGANR